MIFFEAFCLTLPEKLRDKMGGASITIFRPKCFVAQCRKMFVVESFSVSLISVIEKLYA